MDKTRLWALVPVAFGVLLNAMIQKSPEEVISNISKWLKPLRISPSWLKNENADKIIKYITHLLISGGIIYFLWPVPSWVKNKLEVKSEIPSPQKPEISNPVSTETHKPQVSKKLEKFKGKIQFRLAGHEDRAKAPYDFYELPDGLKIRQDAFKIYKGEHGGYYRIDIIYDGPRLSKYYLSLQLGNNKPIPSSRNFLDKSSTWTIGANDFDGIAACGADDVSGKLVFRYKDMEPIVKTFPTICE